MVVVKILHDSKVTKSYQRRNKYDYKVTNTGDKKRLAGCHWDEVNNKLRSKYVYDSKRRRRFIGRRVRRRERNII